jgi:hypothetical protein
MRGGGDMTNSFAAVVSVLIDRIAALTEKASYEIGRERQALLDEAEEMRVGWRVLKAAGKVDKELAIKTLRRLYHPMFQEKGRPVSVPIFDTIMPILEAIPDKEKP